jgi:hypothetical protein
MDLSFIDTLFDGETEVRAWKDMTEEEKEEWEEIQRQSDKDRFY